MNRFRKLMTRMPKTGSSTARKTKASSAKLSTGTSKTIDVDGLTVNVTRKNVKNISIRISPDGKSVKASIPSWRQEAELIRFVQKKRPWILQNMERLAQSPQAKAAEASPEEIEEWRALVKACVPALIEVWEPIMGVKAGKITYRNMKSRWGSCQPSTGHITINIRLALYPPECLEYVVVHELCHLLERGHGPRFHALMDKYLPDWKTRRAKLR